MRIALLTNRRSIHSIRWCNSLAERGHEIHLISMHPQIDPIRDDVIQYNLLPAPPWGYFIDVMQLKKLLAHIQPDVLHAHFASGYGTLARLSRYHPFILSVWGSDVFDFPSHSSLHRRILVDNLCASDWICSTSNIMARETTNLTNSIKNRISVVPFGIDCNTFRPLGGFRDSQYITIGTVKTMAVKYGIDILIEAFSILFHRISIESSPRAEKLRLVLVGGGPEKSKDDQTTMLKQMCVDLGIQEKVTFIGQVKHAEVPTWLNRFDIYAALSRNNSESFGVAVLEAGACELPVVASRVGGFPEVVQDGLTGYVVPNENASQAADAIYRLVADATLRANMGQAGRKFVRANFDWEQNVSQMEQIYASILKITNFPTSP